MQSDAAVSVLSAMITPAILILACSSLITATSSRLSRVLERVRSLAQDAESATDGGARKKREFILAQILRSTRRAKLLQRSMMYLYLGLGTLMLTSITIGIGGALGEGLISPVFVTAGGLIAVGFMLYASGLLIFESRIAFKSVNAEMDYVRNLAPSND